MADYLTRLAARALGLAPTVQPRLPPRFAPLPPEGFERRGWTDDDLPAADPAADGDPAGDSDRRGEEVRR